MINHCNVLSHILQVLQAYLVMVCEKGKSVYYGYVNNQLNQLVVPQLPLVDFIIQSVR